MNKKALWTTGYAFLNIAYFAAFCTVHACAAVFLMSRGFTNTQVGILLATANITSALFQPFIADVIDKKGWLTNRRFIMISCIVILAGSLVLRFISDKMQSTLSAPHIAMYIIAKMSDLRYKISIFHANLFCFFIHISSNFRSNNSCNYI